MNSYRKGYVYYKDEYAGILEETDSGYLFTYDNQYFQKDDSKPISLTLPMTQETYESKTLFSFFDGLIPEGWLLDFVSHNWKIDKNNRFSILLHIGKDTVGAVSILREKL